MKKFKKCAAIFCAATMVISPMSVAAADPTSATGTGSLEGYVIQESYAVVVPTVAVNSLNFKLDPQSLLSISDGSNYSGEKAGSIIYTATKGTSSNVISATNKSSYPVTLTAGVKLTNNTTTNKVIYTSKAGVAADTGLNVYFAAIPEKDTTDYTTSPIVSKPSDTTSVPITTDGTAKFQFLLDGSTDNFEITNSGTVEAPVYAYTQKTGATWDTVGFTLTGLCNQNANWDAFNKEAVALVDKTAFDSEVTWTFAKSSEEEKAFTTGGADASGLITNGTGNSPLVTVDAPKAPVIDTPDYNIVAGTKVDVAVTAGAGALAIDATTPITSITDAGSAIDAKYYSYDKASNTLTFTSDYIDSLITAKTTTKALVINLKTGETTTALNVTLNYSTLPKLTSGNTEPITIDASTTTSDITFDLGLGSAAANATTPITSVTYGSDTTLTLGTDYTVDIATNTLTFTESYIDSITDATETESRVHTITFNNGDTKTTETVTLVHTYTIPNIDPTYFGSATSVNVSLTDTKINLAFDLGSGSKAVTISKVDLYIGTSATGTVYPVTNEDKSAAFTISNGNLELQSTSSSVQYLLDTAGSYTAQVTTSDNVTKTISIVCK